MANQVEGPLAVTDAAKRAGLTVQVPKKPLADFYSPGSSHARVALENTGIKFGLRIGSCRSF